MEAYNFFLNDEGHLRSGWRLAIFAISFLICAQLGEVLLLWGIAGALHRPAQEVAGSNWGFIAGHGALLIAAALMGWACGALFEELPFRALGCLPQRGWLKNLGIGSALGAASLILAALLASATRSIHFSFGTAGPRSIGATVAVSALVFVFAAAAEEMLFRGYPLQTLTRANLAWLGVMLTSVAFASVHLGNPNVVPRLTFLNTTLAGVLLAVGYLRTGSLWFPIGWHWAWNWMQGSVVGLPVSGIERLAPAPLFRTVNSGPEWLTGGAYGIEGGAACTIALLISTLIIWRTKLISAADVPTGRGATPSNKPV